MPGSVGGAARSEVVTVAKGGEQGREGGLGGAVEAWACTLVEG